MLKSFFMMAFAIFAFAAPVKAMEPLADTSKPTVAIFYADWCGSCKILDPRMKEAMASMDNADALNVVTFDLTDDTTKAKSADMAGANGLTDLYNDLAPKTGMAVLVKNGKEAVRITKKDSVEVIKAKLETFIALNL
jgi:thiol-disulfide isomerase/thioredoxin